MRAKAPWAPRVYGAAMTLLTLASARELMAIPVGRGEFQLLGMLLTDSAAWIAAAINVLVQAAIAYGCFMNMRAALWGLMSYCAYWALNIWFWSITSTGGTDLTRGAVLTGLLVTAMLAGVCRNLYAHLDDFNQ
jgi:hypothetical protein